MIDVEDDDVEDFVDENSRTPYQNSTRLPISIFNLTWPNTWSLLLLVTSNRSFNRHWPTTPVRARNIPSWI